MNPILFFCQKGKEEIATIINLDRVVYKQDKKIQGKQNSHSGGNCYIRDRPDQGYRFIRDKGKEKLQA